MNNFNTHAAKNVSAANYDNYEKATHLCVCDRKHTMDRKY